MILKKDKQIADLIKSLSGGEGLNHFSYSQLQQSISMWIVNYFVRTQAQRRKDKKKFLVGFGSVASNVAQMITGRYIFHGAEREEIKEKDYAKVFQHEYKRYLDEPFDERDKYIREQVEQHLHDTIKNILQTVKNIFGDDELQCERYVDMIPKDLMIGMTGRIDYEADTKFAECKTKPPTVRDVKGELRFYSKKLPTDPDPKNVMQVAFYTLASGKEPFLFYANEKDYIIFDQSHPMLKQDYLEYCLDQMIRKAMTIQRLLIASNGDPKIMAGFVERPDLDNWMLKDASTEQLAIIKQLWG